MPPCQRWQKARQIRATRTRITPWRSLYAFLAGYTLTRDIGSQFEYSNLGMSLLGRALASQAKMDYEPLVVDHVCEPLRMLDTRITLPKALATRLAAPYDETALPRPPTGTSARLPAAGGLRSDVDDLFKFLAANLELRRSPLTAALLAAQTTRANAGTPDDGHRPRLAHQQNLFAADHLA